MGNIPSGPNGAPVFVVPKCPVPFESAGSLNCVMPCPTDKGFERRNEGGALRCVYKSEPKFAATLNIVTAPMFSGNTLEDLRAGNPTAYAEFVKEQDRFNNEVNVLYANIDKGRKLNDAFAELQAAENARDVAPTAYQQARMVYYTLLKGDSWKAEEKERIAKAEVNPIVDQYKSNRDAALRQFQNQKRTVEVVNGLKDHVLSLKDEVRYSADTFTEQLDKVRTAINMERRDRIQETTVSPWTWFDTILNVAIVVSLLVAIAVIYPKVFRPSPVATSGVLVQPVR